MLSLTEVWWYLTPIFQPGAFHCCHTLTEPWCQAQLGQLTEKWEFNWMSGVGGKCESSHQETMTQFRDAFIIDRKRTLLGKWKSGQLTVVSLSQKHSHVPQFLNEGSEPSLSDCDGSSCPTWAAHTPARDSIWHHVLLALHEGTNRLQHLQMHLPEIQCSVSSFTSFKALMSLFSGNFFYQCSPSGPQFSSKIEVCFSLDWSLAQIFQAWLLSGSKPQLQHCRSFGLVGITAQSHLLTHKNGIQQHHISTSSHIALGRNWRTGGPFSGPHQGGLTSCLQHRDITFRMGRTSLCTPMWIALLLHIARAISWPA